MLAEMDEGRIGTIIVKDMSRLGRDYLKVGYYTEVAFPNADVRFIAVSNGVDSANQQEKRSGNLQNFGRVISADTRPSEADLACCSLRVLVRQSTAQMDRALFRRCGLYRDKWDRPQSGSTYGQITLEKAASSVPPSISLFCIPTLRMTLAFSRRGWQN